ncbi:MAG: hypothetical protein U9O98_04430 [Asgard group archaeon]|nr:hypothetical protein [Asgard group archaeon]
MNSKQEEKNRTRREIDFELVAKIVMILGIIGIIVASILIFTPPVGDEGYAELGLLTYNDSTQEFEATNYPTEVDYNTTTGQSNNITLYVVIGNYYDEAKFFEVRLKIGLQDVLINEETYGTEENSFNYAEKDIYRILGPNKQWGPNENTKFEFAINSTIISDVGIHENGYKLIFELWEWNSSSDNFTYTGIFAYLTSFQLNEVS